MSTDCPETDAEIRAILAKRRRGAYWKGEGEPVAAIGTICEFIPPSVDRSNIEWIESWVGSPAAGALLRIEGRVAFTEDQRMPYVQQARLKDVITLVDALHIATDVVGRLVAERDALLMELDAAREQSAIDSAEAPRVTV